MSVRRDREPRDHFRREPYPPNREGPQADRGYRHAAGIDSGFGLVGGDVRWLSTTLNPLGVFVHAINWSKELG